jgi:demethylmenaquinone methyltransferase/2-methoxy-6-polyprenyl-1,4-benzoquinol methylase
MIRPMPSPETAIRPATPTPGAPEKEAVRSMFDRIAPRYDLLNRVLSAGVDVQWRRRAVRALGVPQGSRVLDLCTGTADLLLEALSQDPRGKGVGADLSQGMLRLGAEKIQRRALSGRAALAASDAERLAFRGGAFDGVLVAFGIRNVGNIPMALGELRRVLRPGGRLVVLEISMPRGPLGRAYRFYFERVLPLLGGLVSGDPGAYAYLPASVGQFPEPLRFRGIVEEAGFRDVRAEALTFGIAHLYSASRP